jgi:hypothetical protein
MLELLEPPVATCGHAGRFRASKASPIGVEDTRSQDCGYGGCPFVSMNASSQKAELSGISHSEEKLY